MCVSCLHAYEYIQGVAMQERMKIQIFLFLDNT